MDTWSAYNRDQGVTSREASAARRKRQRPSTTKIVNDFVIPQTVVTPEESQQRIAAATAATTPDPRGNPGVLPPGGFEMGTYGTETAFGDKFLNSNLTNVYDNPTNIVSEWFRQQGIGTNGGSYAQAMGQADTLPILWLLAQGNEVGKGSANFADWAGNYMNSTREAGGTGFGPQDVMNSIFGGAAVKDPNSVLGQSLHNSSLTAEDQVGNMLSTLGKGFESNMPDVVRAALLSRARQLGDEFENVRNRKDGDTNFSQFLQRNEFDQMIPR